MEALIYWGDLRHTFTQTGRVDGSVIFSGTLLAALLKYGTQRTVFLPEQAVERLPQTERSALTQSSRCQIIRPEQLKDILRFKRVALITSGPDLLQLALLRAQYFRMNCPITGFVHSIDPLRLSRMFTNNLMTLLGPQDALICSTPSAQAVVERIKGALPGCLSGTTGEPLKCPVIPLGVEYDQFAGGRSTAFRSQLDLTGTDRVALYFGRFSTRYKADLIPLLIAFAKVQTQLPDARLVLAGNDPSEQTVVELRRAATLLGCLNSIRIITNPGLDDKVALYAAADAFVSPADNIQETFGISLIEAMAAGLPVIASDWNGYRHVVTDGESGILVPTLWTSAAGCGIDRQLAGGATNEEQLAWETAIDIAALEKALLSMLGDDAKRHSMAEKARLRAKQIFDWKVVIPQYEALWRSLSDADVCNSPALTQSLDYRQLFGSYVSKVLSDDTRLELDPANSEALTSLAFTGMDEQADQVRAAHSILAHVTGREQSTIGSATGLPATTAADRSLLLRTIARLLKYGILRPGRPSAESCNDPETTVPTL